MTTSQQPQIAALRLQYAQMMAWLTTLLMLGGAVASSFWTDTTEIFASAVLVAVLAFPLLWRMHELGIKAFASKWDTGWWVVAAANAVAVIGLLLGATVAPAGLMAMVFAVPLAVAFGPLGERKAISGISRLSRNMLNYGLGLPTVFAGLALMQLSGSDAFGVEVQIDHLTAMLLLGFAMLLMPLAMLGPSYAVKMRACFEESAAGVKSLHKGFAAKISLMSLSFLSFSLMLFVAAALTETGVLGQDASLLMLLAGSLAMVLAIMLSNAYGNYVTAVDSSSGLSSSDASAWLHALEFGRCLVGVPLLAEGYGDSWELGAGTGHGGVAPVSAASVSGPPATGSPTPVATPSPDDPPPPAVEAEGTDPAVLRRWAERFGEQKSKQWQAERMQMNSGHASGVFASSGISVEERPSFMEYMGLCFRRGSNIWLALDERVGSGAASTAESRPDAAVSKLST